MLELVGNHVEPFPLLSRLCPCETFFFMFFRKLTDSLIGSVTGGAVIGFDGCIWSSTPGFYGNPAEFAIIATIFNPHSEAAYKGILFLGELYVLTFISEHTIIAQKNNHFIVLARCPKCLVFGYHDEQVPYEKCYKAVCMVAQQIRDNDEYE